MNVRRVQAEPSLDGYLVASQLWRYPWGWEWDYLGIFRYRASRKPTGSTPEVSA